MRYQTDVSDGGRVSAAKPGRAIACLRLFGSLRRANVVTTSSVLPRPGRVAAQDTCALAAPQTDAHPRPPPAQVRAHGRAHVHPSVGAVALGTAPRDTRGLQAIASVADLRRRSMWVRPFLDL